MKKILTPITCAVILGLLSLSTYAQQKYLIEFTDKDGVEFDPISYFDAKAIERRIVNEIPLSHFTDWPVKKSYSTTIDNLVEESIFISRWLNGQVVLAHADQIDIIEDLDFVKAVQVLESHAALADYDESQAAALNKEELIKAQVESLEGHLFEKENMKGKGVRVAVFDVGFNQVDTHGAFKHIRNEGRIVKTYDFIAKEEHVYKGGSHGRSVLSCIAGIYDDQRLGLASDAEFLLARTEYKSKEPLAEEEFWLAAAEWADKNGAQIINSSLGYTSDRYFQHEMDGHTSLVAQAARLAVRKGMLVVNSMGNEGDSQWKVLVTPADVDSVLSIGGIKPGTGYHTSFSSYGPSKDKSIKPNVSAFGHVIAAASSGLQNTQGTSFSSPLVAGFAACVLGANPNLKAMELYHEIQKSASLFPYFDYAHGYGLPQASYFISKITMPSNKVELIENGNTITIKVAQEVMEAEVPLMYYHIQKPDGSLIKYAVIGIQQQEVLSFSINNFKPGQTLRVHVGGQTLEKKF